MPQSLANVLLHIIYSTKNRDAFLSDKGIRAEIHAYLGGTCNDCGCSVLTVGGVADHVHILCSLSRTMAIADLLKRGKGVFFKMGEDERGNSREVLMAKRVRRVFRGANRSRTRDHIHSESG